MGNLFGRKKQSRVTEQDRAILVRGRRRAGVGADLMGETEAGSGSGRDSTAIARPAADIWTGQGSARKDQDCV